MLTLEQIDIIEGETTCTMREYAQAMQQAINDGAAWCFQGSYGRAMMDAINAGDCMLGKKRARDYYGNTIPSRDDVQAGTKGSFEYVSKINGEEYAKFIGEL